LEDIRKAWHKRLGTAGQPPPTEGERKVYVTPQGDQVFVVDGHIHLWDARPENRRNRYGLTFIESFWGSHVGMTPIEQRWDFDRFCYYGVEGAAKDLFTDGYVDVGIMLPTDLREFYINGFNTIIVRLVGDKRTIVLLDNTSQGRYLDGFALAITNILYDLPYEAPKQSFQEAMLKLAVENGVSTAIALYRTLKAEHANEFDFSEMELNTLGYQLMQVKKVAEAIEIFKLNVEAYPQSSNVYDSLGEAYMNDGNKQQAIANYQKSLQLNPKNSNGLKMLQKLKAP